MSEIFILLFLFQIKHFLCDFPLQGKFMLGKFSPDPWTWIPALTAHSGVHSVGTFAVMFVFEVFITPGVSGPWWWCFIPWLDMAIHFTVDRIKASPNMLGRWKPDNKYFWWSLGGDQMAHHLTHYAIIALLVLA